MNTSMGFIVWPADATAACRHYLGFVLQVVDRLGIPFPPSCPDPVATARGYIAGTVSEADYLSALGMRPRAH